MMPRERSPGSTRLKGKVSAKGDGADALLDDGVTFDGVGRHHDVFGRVAREGPGFGGAFEALAQFHRAGGVANARRQPQQDGGVEALGEVEGGDGQVFGLLAIGRLQAGDAGKLGEVAVVLFVLAGVHGGVIGADDDQPGLDAGHGGVHERVGGHVQADVFHGSQGAFAGIGCADGHVHGHFFVGGPFGVDVGEEGEIFEDFGAGGARVGRGHLHAGLPHAARHGFVTGEHLFEGQGELLFS